MPILGQELALAKIKELKNKLSLLEAVIQYPNSAVSLNIEKLINELPLDFQTSLGFGFKIESKKQIQKVIFKNDYKFEIEKTNSIVNEI